jgi:hypothetical protein
MWQKLSPAEQRSPSVWQHNRLMPANHFAMRPRNATTPKGNSAVHYEKRLRSDFAEIPQRSVTFN